MPRRPLSESSISNVPQALRPSVSGSTAVLHSGCHSLCAPLSSPFHFPRSPTRRPKPEFKGQEGTESEMEAGTGIEPEN